MSYQLALENAWFKLKELSSQNIQSIKFLSDEYTIDLNKHSIISLSCNVPASEHVSILLLHYQIRSFVTLPELSNKWISFNEIPGGKEYYPTYRKRAIEPILRKYASSPESLLNCVERFNAKKIQIGDVGIVIPVFEKIPLMVGLWKPDEEFGAEANLLFDANITEIFPTEDIVVMASFVASNI